MPDNANDSGGLRQEDLDRMQMQEQLADRERSTREALERQDLERDTQPMSPDSVANFETFPPVPSDNPIAPPPESGGFLDAKPPHPMSADTVRDFETFRDADGNPIETDRSSVLDMEFKDDEPEPVAASAPRLTDAEEGIASDAFLADHVPSETGAVLPPSLRPMTPESVANFETFPPLPDDYDPKPEPQDEGIEVMQAPGASGIGGMARTLFAVGGGVVLIGLALVALLGRGGTTPAATPASSGGAPASTIAAAAPASSVSHPPCTARSVSPAEAEAIPSNQRWQVGVYCIGGHWYPVEQFKVESSNDCQYQPGVLGPGSFYTTKSGGPAHAIDDDSIIPNPGAKACGFLTFAEVAARAKDVNERLPNGMFPTSTTRYRAFQARAGIGGN